MRLRIRRTPVLCWIGLSLWLGLGAPFAGAAEFDPQVLSELRPALQKYVDQKVVSGLVAVVGSKAGIARYEVLGTTGLEPDTEMQADSLFRIASMTKPITALAAMQLVEQGRLSLDEPVEKYLPEFKGQLLISERSAESVKLVRPGRPITLRDLLSHTSGLPGGFPEGLADLYFRRHLTLKEAVLVSSQRPLEFAPGSRWAYCNAGIDTVGRVIEVVSGESYADYLQQHIFEPLGMTDTACFPDAERLKKLAGLHEIKDNALHLVDRPLVGPSQGAVHPIPAGGLISNGIDLARLYQALLNGGKLGETRIISEASLAEMTRVQTGDLPCGFVPGMSFGLGFAVVKEPQGVTEMLGTGTYGHGGAFGTQGWLDPEHDLFVILLIQRVGLPNADASDMRRDLQRIAVRALRSK